MISKIIANRYRVDQLIGQGSMSFVYQAFDLTQNQPVALKILKEAKLSGGWKAFYDSNGKR